MIATIVALATGVVAAPTANARIYHRTHRTVVAAPARQPMPQPQRVVGYFGPGAYGPYGYGYGYGPGWNGPRGDLGFALLGAMNGGGFRGFVECGNYYARTPGACGF